MNQNNDKKKINLPHHPALIEIILKSQPRGQISIVMMYFSSIWGYEIISSKYLFANMCPKQYFIEHQWQLRTKLAFSHNIFANLMLTGYFYKHIFKVWGNHYCNTFKVSVTIYNRIFKNVFPHNWVN